jgi:hypothetical protein
MDEFAVPQVIGRDRRRQRDVVKAETVQRLDGVMFVADLNRTELQNKFPTIATEIPQYCKPLIEGAGPK